VKSSWHLSLADVLRLVFDTAALRLERTVVDLVADARLLAFELMPYMPVSRTDPFPFPCRAHRCQFHA
jgi:hypothetical protein